MAMTGGQRSKSKVFIALIVYRFETMSLIEFEACQPGHVGWPARSGDSLVDTFPALEDRSASLCLVVTWTLEG